MTGHVIIPEGVDAKHPVSLESTGSQPKIDGVAAVLVTIAPLSEQHMVVTVVEGNQ